MLSVNEKCWHGNKMGNELRQYSHFHIPRKLNLETPAVTFRWSRNLQALLGNKSSVNGENPRSHRTNNSTLYSNPYRKNMEFCCKQFVSTKWCDYNVKNIITVTLSIQTLLQIKISHIFNAIHALSKWNIQESQKRGSISD